MQWECNLHELQKGKYSTLQGKIGKENLNNYVIYFFFFPLDTSVEIFHKTHHERPLFDLLKNDSTALWHPGYQHGHRSDGKPADIKTTSSCVQFVDFGGARPK